MAQLLNTALINSANLKAYYRFESGALTTDSSSGGITLTNTNTVAEITGKYGGAMDTGTTNSTKYMLANTDLGIGGGAISMVGWFRMRTEIGSGDQCFIMQEDAGTHVRYDIRYDYNGGTRRLNFSRVKMNVAGETVNSTITMGTALFYHLALTYDATTLRAYVNGVEVGNTTASGSGAAVGVDSIKIGVGDDGSFLEAYASIAADDCAYFNAALTAAQITTLYQGGGISPALL